MIPIDKMTAASVRVQYRRLMDDERLLESERHRIRYSVIGPLPTPPTIGEAMRIIVKLQEKLHEVTSEVPM